MTAKLTRLKFLCGERVLTGHGIFLSLRLLEESKEN